MTEASWMNVRKRFKIHYTALMQVLLQWRKKASAFSDGEEYMAKKCGYQAQMQDSFLMSSANGIKYPSIFIEEFPEPTEYSTFFDCTQKME